MDFLEHGPQVIARVRQERPHQYLRIIASVLPREIVLEDERPRDLREYTHAELMEMIVDAAEGRTGSPQSDRQPVAAVEIPLGLR